MWRLPIVSLRAFAVSFSCLALALFPMVLLLKAAPQSARARQDLHLILSQKTLAPALHSPEASLRYSPDGRYLLFQDGSTIAVLSVKPLAILLEIFAGDIYPAQFSANSENVTLVGRGLRFGRWRLPDGKKIANGDLPSEENCEDGELSPGGEYFACVSAGLRFTLFSVSTQKSVFDDFIPGVPRQLPGRFHPRNQLPLVFILSLDTHAAFAGPFGLFRTSIPMPSPNRTLSDSFIHFSPDGKVAISNSPGGSLGLDIAAKKRFELPDRMRKAMSATIALLSSDRAVLLEKGKQNQSSVLSLKNGKVLASPVFQADRIRIATDPRYLILYRSGSDGQSAEAFDLEQNRAVGAPPSISMDICGSELAVYTVSGSVALYRLGERRLFANLKLPLSRLPLLRSASVSRDLDQLALSVDGAGAVFQIDTGQRLASFREFSSLNFSEHQEAYLLFPRSHQDPAQIRSWNPVTGASSTSWEVGKEVQVHAGGPVLLEYSHKKEMKFSQLEAQDLQIPYRLRGLDPASGKELWKRDFEEDPPTPFADPQGERLVLGWKAKSFGAKDAAGRDPVAHSLYKGAKLNGGDSFFEVLDARAGKSLGGVLVQVGNGAPSFDSAFSAGGTLILIRDGVRISLYSLHDGKLKAHLVGARLAVTGQSNLLALDSGAGRLGIFDLNSGAKLDEQIFPEEIAYVHFSGDGKRLFVLTEHEAAAILDVSKLRDESGKTPGAAP